MSWEERWRGQIATDAGCECDFVSYGSAGGHVMAVFGDNSA
jgi:hypothetical protein